MWTALEVPRDYLLFKKKKRNEGIFGFCKKDGKGLNGNWDRPFNSTYIPSNSVVMSPSGEGSGGLTESEAIRRGIDEIFNVVMRIWWRK